MPTKHQKNWLVLHLPQRSSAVYYRPHLETASGRTFHTWAVNRFSHFARVLTVHHGGLDAHYFSACPQAPHRAIQCDAPTEVDALVTAARSLKTDVLTYCSLEAAFLPAAIFEGALRQHRQSGAHFTAVRNLPEGVAVAVYSRELLLRLSECVLPPRPGAIAELIHRVSTDNLHRAAAGLQPLFPAIRSTVYDAPLPVKPRILTLQTITDIAIARKAIAHRCSPGASLIEPWMRAAADPIPPPAWHCPRTRRRRVLFFSNHSGYSGAEDTLADTVHALPEGEFDKTAFIPAPGLYADRMHAAGCRVFQWTEDLSAPTARNVSAISDLLKTLKPDVIHLNAYAGMPILAAARSAGISVIQHLRLPDLTRLEESIRESSIVLAVSDYVRRQAAGIPVPPRRIQVLYDGVNTTRFDPSHEDKSAARQSLGIDATRIVILLAARLERRKRADLFIAAIKTAAATNPNVLGLVVGDGSQDPDWTSVIDRAIEESGVDVVRRLPFQPDMRGVYPAADVVVSCSDREPLGCSILEAMAMELPTIVSDSGGTMELLQPDRTGLIFPAGDANELARAISKLTNDPQLRIRMGRRARRHVLSRFSIERCAAALASHLAALCKPQK